MMNNAQGGGNRVLNFGKSKAKQLNKDMPKTTFADVAGADEAVEELYEIKDFLQNPTRYQALGAKIPKGVLLYGPPGTGKTLLARAVAGEAGVPFFTISGSDFVEMFVGVGASRVRDMFEQAKQNSPCIIFVDEIDAVGRQRGAGLGGGHEKKITAYHEGGHTLAAWAMPDIEPIYKVTILARGRTGGHAMSVPEDDKGLMTRSEMIARLVFAMGGRAAEELVFREPTTGASSDIDQATKIARAMVTEYGMSARLGAVRYGREHGDPFLGRTMSNQPDYSLEVAHEIDE